MQAIGFRAMNTSVLLAAEGEGVEISIGVHATKLFIEDCEQRFSRFLPNSELSQLNRAAGRWTQVSDDLLDLLQQSMKFYAETNGIFDPSILPDLRSAGYDRSMDEIRAERATVAIPASKRTSRPALDEIDFDLANQRVRLPRGLEIDLGGIAKGWIVDRAAHLLNEYTEICAVSAGGDMLFMGHPLDGLDWDVYLEDPQDPSQVLAQFHVGPGAIATSSVTKRTWYQGDKPRHHLIDPRTGEPAETEWLSVTVIAPALIVAEVYAKALLIVGEEYASTVQRRRPEIAYLTVDLEGNLSGSPNSKEYVVNEVAANTY